MAEYLYERHQTWRQPAVQRTGVELGAGVPAPPVRKLAPKLCVRAKKTPRMCRPVKKVVTLRKHRLHHRVYEERRFSLVPHSSPISHSSHLTSAHRPVLSTTSPNIITIRMRGFILGSLALAALIGSAIAVSMAPDISTLARRVKLTPALAYFSSAQVQVPVRVASCAAESCAIAPLLHPSCAPREAAWTPCECPLATIHVLDLCLRF